MTKEEIKKAAGKAARAIEEDRAKKKEYNRTWITLAVLYTAYALILHGIYHLIISFASYAVLGAVPVLYLVIFYAPLQFLGLCFLKGAGNVRLHNGKRYFNLLGFICRIISFEACLTPTAILVMIFNFDEETRSFSGPGLFKIYLVYAPIVLAVVMFIGWFYGTVGPYSDAPKMTKGDLVTMRREMEIAGIDPDKMPIVLPASTIKKMSKADWYDMAMDMKIAGYDVFK